MIAFDTNVLLRLLLNDDKRQAGQAQALLDRVVQASDRVLLPDIVLCELEWVLDSVYQLPRSRVLETFQRLIDADEFTYLSHAAFSRAVGEYRKGKADLSDYLIGTSAAAAGATTTYTFDRVLLQSGGFSRPG